MKSKDPDCKIPVDSSSFRCFKCDNVLLKNATGCGMNEVEPGLAVMVCNECFKPSKVPKVENE